MLLYCLRAFKLVCFSTETLFNSETLYSQASDTNRLFSCVKRIYNTLFMSCFFDYHATDAAKIYDRERYPLGADVIGGLLQIHCRKSLKVCSFLSVRENLINNTVTLICNILPLMTIA